MKKLYVILLVVLSIGLAVAGCSQPPPSSAPGPSPAPAPAPEKPSFPKLTFVTPPSGTQPNTVAVAWSTLATKYVPGLQILIEPAIGAPHAVAGFLKGNGDICYTSANIFGTEFPKQHGGKTLSEGPMHLIASEGGCVHIVARAESGIASITDFKGKKILGKVATGGGVDLTRSKIFAAYGLTDADVVLMSGNNGSHLAEQLKEGVGDAALIFLGLKDASVIDLCTSKNIRWIDLPKDKLNAIADEAWHVAGIIPAGTYPKQDKDVLALRTPTSFDVQPTMSEAVAYELVKLYYDHRDEFVKMAPFANAYSLEASIKSAYLPFHPGAVKYYKEKGAWTSEVDARQNQLLKKVIK